MMMVKKEKDIIRKINKFYKINKIERKIKNLSCLNDNEYKIFVINNYFKLELFNLNKLDLNKYINKVKNNNVNINVLLKKLECVENE